MTKNQKVTKEELAKIRRLSDFDLVMLISDIHDHDWPTARTTLAMMPDGPNAPDVEMWETLSKATQPGGALYNHPNILKPKKR